MLPLQPSQPGLQATQSTHAARAVRSSCPRSHLRNLRDGRGAFLPSPRACGAACTATPSHPLPKTRASTRHLPCVICKRVASGGSHSALVRTSQLLRAQHRARTPPLAPISAAHTHIPARHCKPSGATVEVESAASAFSTPFLLACYTSLYHSQRVSSLPPFVALIALSRLPARPRANPRHCGPFFARRLRAPRPPSC